MTYGHLQADCLYTGISSGPNARCRVWEAFTFFTRRLTDSHACFSWRHTRSLFTRMTRKKQISNTGDGSTAVKHENERVRHAWDSVKDGELYIIGTVSCQTPLCRHDTECKAVNGLCDLSNTYCCIYIILFRRAGA